MSIAKVVRVRQNLDKVTKQFIESLGDTLQYSPPNKQSRRKRQRHYKLAVDVRIEEVDKNDAAVGSYEHHIRTTKVFVE